MISVKEAVSRASQYLGEVFDDLNYLRLEEVERSDDDSQWYVTLSYLLPEPPDSPLASFHLGKKYERVYKQVVVDANSGQCQSIKIRQLQ